MVQLIKNKIKKTTEKQYFNHNIIFKIKIKILLVIFIYQYKHLLIQSISKRVSNIETSKCIYFVQDTFGMSLYSLKLSKCLL